MAALTITLGEGLDQISFSHVAAARKRSHQWCLTLTPNNTETIERLTCHCFLQRPIIRDLTNSSYTTISWLVFFLVFVIAVLLRCWLCKKNDWITWWITWHDFRQRYSQWPLITSVFTFSPEIWFKRPIFFLLVRKCALFFILLGLTWQKQVNFLLLILRKQKCPFIECSIFVYTPDI